MILSVFINNRLRCLLSKRYYRAAARIMLAFLMEGFGSGGKKNFELGGDRSQIECVLFLLVDS